jgi:apolipoprotein N-acyltransferase
MAIQWRHLEWHVDSKTGQRYLRIWVSGKTGGRWLIAKHWAIAVFERLALRQGMGNNLDRAITAASDAWVFATSWLIASVWWLYISMHDFGGLPASLTLLAILLLCGGLAIYYALTISLYFKCKHANPWLSGVLFATCWTLAEIARAEFFTGFPWGAIGYAHIDSVLVILAPWVGVYGICWVAAFLAASFSSSIEKFQQKTKNRKYDTNFSIAIS